MHINRNLHRTPSPWTISSLNLRNGKIKILERVIISRNMNDAECCWFKQHPLIKSTLCPLPPHPAPCNAPPASKLPVMGQGTGRAAEGAGGICVKSLAAPQSGLRIAALPFTKLGKLLNFPRTAFSYPRYGDGDRCCNGGGRVPSPGASTRRPLSSPIAAVGAWFPPLSHCAQDPPSKGVQKPWSVRNL